MNIIKAIRNLWDKWIGIIGHPRIMAICFFPEQKLIQCKDWQSKEISYLSGAFSWSLWTDIKNHCIVKKKFPYTRISIWISDGQSGNIKYLAYSEPIHHYIMTPSLLYTGQGFDTHNPPTTFHEKEDKCMKHWIRIYGKQKGERAPIT